MKFQQIYAADLPRFSFELYPPKTERGEAQLLHAAEKLAALSPAFFSMTYGAGGGTRGKTIELGRRVHELTQIEMACHVTCVGQSKDAVRSIIRQIKALGFDNILALRGDPPRDREHWEPHPDGFHHASELVAEIRSMGGLEVGVAGFPEMHPESANREVDLRFLKQKIETGADVVITQLFFDNDLFYRFDRDLKALGIDKPVVPGILPITSVQGVRRLAKLCQASIPDQLNRQLDDVADDDEATRRLGIDYAARQIQELIDYGVPGVHLYCLNRSSALIAIFKKLGLA